MPATIIILRRAGLSMAIMRRGLPQAALGTNALLLHVPLGLPAMGLQSFVRPGFAASHRFLCVSSKQMAGAGAHGGGGIRGRYPNDGEKHGNAVDGEGSAVNLEQELRDLDREWAKLERDFDQLTLKASTAIKKLAPSTNLDTGAKLPTDRSASKAKDARGTSSNTKLGSAPPKSIRSSLYKEDLYWEDRTTEFKITKFSELPHVDFGVNQHMVINNELKEVLRLLLYQFKAPIMYAFAYGSGIFPQSKPGRRVSDEEFRAVHPKPPEALIEGQNGNPKMIDFIFGVTHPYHWHSLNIKQHPDHYSCISKMGSYFVSKVQDNFGAGVYFNPYVVVNGILIKYGVASIDNICRDLGNWDNLYLAGRLHKPVKILRDHPSVRLANQVNLIAALRTALLLLPIRFTEKQLYGTIAGISYLGDPRMALPAENPSKVTNIVENNMHMFRRLYGPLIDTLPNIKWDDPSAKANIWLTNPETDLHLVQNMDASRRANMVRRLPSAFRSRLYFKYQKKFGIPHEEFNRMMEETKDDDRASVKRLQGGEFERRIAQDKPEELRVAVRQVIKQTINWPATSQSIKSAFTAGTGRTVRYLGEKVTKWREGKKQAAGAASASGREEEAGKKSDKV